MVKLIVQDYDIVEKESTRVLIKTLYECKAIYNASLLLSEETLVEADNVLDSEIDRKLKRCFDYYQRNYGVEIVDGYGEMRDIEINLSNICECVRSWED